MPSSPHCLAFVLVLLLTTAPDTPQKDPPAPLDLAAMTLVPADLATARLAMADCPTDSQPRASSRASTPTIFERN